MTSSILLSLEGDVGIPLVARVYHDGVLDRPTADGVPGGLDGEVRQIVVPVVGEVAVPVRPGRYAITLLLPTGRVIRKTCRVETGDEPVIFDARGALSTDLTAGDRFSLQGALLETSQEGLERAILAGSAMNEPSAPAAPIGFEARSKPARKSFGKSERFGAVTVRDRVATKPRPPSLSVAHGKDLESVAAWTKLAEGPASWGKVLYEKLTETTIGASGPTLSMLTRLPLQEHRSWVKVSDAAWIELGAIPFPWGGLGSVAISVDPALAGRAMTDIAVQDASIGALLSYLEQGRLSIISPLLDALEDNGAIERFIYSDSPSPLAACAVAYAFLAIRSPDRNGNWKRWLEDLADRNRSIPDCAIILARFRILQPGIGETLAAVGELERAYQAGIPFYSMGLLMLRDMLTVASARSEALRTMLAAVSPVAARCDPARLFTVLRYPRA